MFKENLLKISRVDFSAWGEIHWDLLKGEAYSQGQMCHRVMDTEKHLESNLT